MLEYVKNLFNDKKTYTIFIATFIVAMFVVIFVTWWPQGDVKEFAKYSKVNMEQKLKDIGNGYMEKLMFYIRYGDAKQITSKIANEYLTYVGKTKEQIEVDMFSKKVIGFRELTISNYENTVVYSTYLLYEDNTTRKMNLVEDYPHSYTITFDDFMGHENINLSTVQDGIRINVNNAYYGENTRVYQVSITNLQNNRVTVDVSNVKKMYLELENGEQYYLSNVVVTTDLESISKGTTLNKTFNFAIPFSIQSKISKMVFKDLKINEGTKSIEVKL